MKKIIYINGSPRGVGNSTSGVILKDIAGILKTAGLDKGEAWIIDLPVKTGQNEEEILASMDEGDIWIIAFPLYIFSLPGHLAWWLECFEKHRSRDGNRKDIKVYAVANCGFPEATHCNSALQIVKFFCRRNSLDWRLGIAMGKGESYKQMKDVPLKSMMKSGILSAYRVLVEDISGKKQASGETLSVAIRLPVFLYNLMGSIGWRMTALKSGLKTKDLYARPLTDN